MNITHHISRDKEVSENNVSCHLCGKAFDSKRTLMSHRKVDHINIIKKCRYFLRGMCDFKDDECWFRHVETSKQISGGAPFKCSFCEKTFDTNTYLIVHRKK